MSDERRPLSTGWLTALSWAAACILAGVLGTVAARSGVISDVPAGETWGGIPAANMRASAPNYAAFRSLAQHVRDLKKLTKRVERLEGSEGGA